MSLQYNIFMLFIGGCTEMYNMKDNDCPDDLFNMMKKAYRYA